QTASSNLSRTSFEPYMHNVVLDPRAVDETSLGASIWEDSDFRTSEDEDEAERAAALEEAQRKARKKEELRRWAETEANRLMAEGTREREAARQAQAAARAREAEREATRQNKCQTEDARRRAASPAASTALDKASLPAATTPTGRAVVSSTPAEPPSAKRPPTKVNGDELR